MSFEALLGMCHPAADPEALFDRAWSAWGASARTFTSDPVASVETITKAKAVFDFLAAQPLPDKPRSKVELCLSQIASLLVVASPEPKSSRARAPQPKSDTRGAAPQKTEPKSAAYAGGIAAPKPDALPSPSMLINSQRSPPTPAPAHPVEPITFSLESVPDGVQGGARDPPVGPSCSASAQPPPTLLPAQSEPAQAPAEGPPLPTTAVATNEAAEALLAQQLASLPDETKTQVAAMPHVADPAKVTGMLLEMGVPQLVRLLCAPEELRRMVDEAVNCLIQFQAKEATNGCERSPGTNVGGPPLSQQACCRLNTADPLGGSVVPVAVCAEACHRPVARQAPPRPAAPQRPPGGANPNAKTKLCKWWVQRGLCHHGSKCQYAHDVSDMVPSARDHTMAKVSTTSAKAFLPLQAMSAPKGSTASSKPFLPLQAMSGLSVKPNGAAAVARSPAVAPAAAAVVPAAAASPSSPEAGPPTDYPSDASTALDGHTSTPASATPTDVPPPLAAVAAAPRPHLPAAEPDVLTQYCSRVVGFSSQFSHSDNAALQLLGPPKHFPKSGSSKFAWSALPQPNTTRQWVRLGVKEPVYVRQIRIFETHNPGSVARIRLAPTEVGKMGADSDWVEVYSSSAERNAAEVAGAKCRVFTPPLSDDALALPSTVVEIEVDTTGWGDSYWSEIDAVQVEGSTAPLDGLDLTNITRQRWETDRQYNMRRRFITNWKMQHGDGDTEHEQLRQAALSMVYTNSKLLGCTYPAEVEQLVGLREHAHTGMAVEGELRAAQASRHG